jgi:ABC-type Fe3+-hydroxamate transport system substrate-binding protein
VDYQSAESQAIQLQQQANQVTQRLKDVADKLQAKIPDPNLSRELMLDLREVAIAIQQQNQSAVAIIQQMAQYIHALESNLANAPPQASYQPLQPRGWYTQPYPSATGGFLGNVATGLGLGAGFGIGEEIVDDIFGRW